MGSRFRVLLAVDEAAGGMHAVHATLELLRHMPNLEITACARTLGQAPAVAGGGTTLLAPVAASKLVQAASDAARTIGVSLRVRETSAPLLEALSRQAPGHDLLVLPRDLGHEATAFNVPVLLV